ncbi:hypothetical protein MtrunA17_Chr7g0239551 [Medicago truncatula]|uniref:Uncharacterized protein n=1 Tax=Medicago truncatula TaxID=3880 RepID=A0A396H3A9_MEDTR|nr:hypothetical protein MtrunA17_Chr7g0239551 [Medicago truncatula]
MERCNALDRMTGCKISTTHRTRSGHNLRSKNYEMESIIGVR